MRFVLHGRLVLVVGLALPAAAQSSLDELVSPLGWPGDAFGTAVDVAGDRILASRPLRAGGGDAVFFERVASAWRRSAQVSGGSGSEFGFSLALEGDRAVVGAPLDDASGTGAGAVHVHEYAGGAWVETAVVTATDAAAGQRFGHSVALDGELLLVGAPGHDLGGTDSGAAYLYEFDAGAWTPYILFMEPVPAAGNHFGFSVGLDGSTALVGAPGSDVAGVDAGAAYPFVFYSPVNWFPWGSVNASPHGAGDRFGYSVAVAGGYAVVGAPRRGQTAGHAHLFQVTQGGWIPHPTAAPKIGSLNFGASVDIWTDPFEGEVRILVGPTPTRVYELVQDDWYSNSTLWAGNGVFCQSVAFDGETAVIGAPFESGGVGAVFARDSLPDIDCGASVSYCDVNPNSTGQPASLHTTGSLSVSDQDLTFHGSQLPPGSHGYVISGFGPWNVAFGAGVLCVAPYVGRVSPLLVADASGMVSWTFDFAPGGNLIVSPFSSPVAQFLFSDGMQNGERIYNFSNALQWQWCP